MAVAVVERRTIHYLIPSLDIFAVTHQRHLINEHNQVGRYTLLRVRSCVQVCTGVLACVYVFVFVCGCVGVCVSV